MVAARYTARAEGKKAIMISFEVAPRLQTASDGVQPLAPSMTGSSLMVRDMPLTPLSQPSDIYIYHNIIANSGETEGRRR